MSKKSKTDDNVVDFTQAFKDKELDRKEEKVAEMAKRFEQAMPFKPTPVKDYLKKKRKNKKKR